MADECGVSKQYAMRLFKKYYNVTVTRYINNYKLQKAKKLLKYTDLNIIEIAYSLGFSKPSYFCRIFQKAYNLLPGKYRKDSPDE